VTPIPPVLNKPDFFSRLAVLCTERLRITLYTNAVASLNVRFFSRDYVAGGNRNIMTGLYQRRIPTQCRTGQRRAAL